MHWKVSVMILTAAALIGCSSKAPDVAANIRNSLDQAGLKDVSVSQNRDKGVVTLEGHVTQQPERDKAEQIAKSMAGGQVVADEIAVLPAGNEGMAKDVNSDLDKGIEANLDAALRQARMKNVSHSTKNGVVTLKGDLDTPARRTEAERLAANVPNVQQVVNQIDVKHRRATTTDNADRSR